MMNRTLKRCLMPLSGLAFMTAVALSQPVQAQTANAQPDLLILPTQEVCRKIAFGDPAQTLPDDGSDLNDPYIDKDEFGKCPSGYITCKTGCCNPKLKEFCYAGVCSIKDKDGNVVPAPKTPRPEGL